MKLDLENIFVQVPTYIFWKDMESNYLGCNPEMARVIGLQSNQEIIGKSDFDLCWHEYGRVFIEGDNAIFDNDNPYPRKEIIVTTDGQEKTIVTYKKLLCNVQGNPIGVVGSYYELLDRAYYGKFDIDKKNIPLTKRQLECLLNLAEGKTARQIALELDLSTRTIEHYINALKIKFNCTKKSDLIKKALSLNYIREKIFLKYSRF